LDNINKKLKVVEIEKEMIGSEKLDFSQIEIEMGDGGSM